MMIASGVYCGSQVKALSIQRPSERNRNLAKKIIDQGKTNKPVQVKAKTIRNAYVKQEKRTKKHAFFFCRPIAF
ncbi:MAG TPA: hypothetical protein DEB17_03235 [Chlorobaculum sp.]|jgi:hypothetical protein|uniref:Uncharacterized protein n=1 Tax=Chlorobaculum tepidum (strain ATCC 49652 / DSM 12025 / NBRC 103806 / TLS) TaxID=194439 RepID=Q8KE44_CHLTE|nr:hypothetical protein CT0846 [Chlorobaculum tepidum TLS]HBU23000.1 hypothetical protein [Chlorobaculum sp.]